MTNDIDARIERALGRIRLAFRGEITLVNAAGHVQFVQGEGFASEKLRDNELFQHYGFTSHPLPGTMAVVLPIGGKTAHGIVIATEHATYRLKGLESGEVALYTDEGDSIVMRRGRLIEVTTDTLKIDAADHVEINTPRVQLNTPLVQTTGEIRADEDITDRLAHPDSASVRAMRELYDVHTHHENDAHGETNVPTQQTGS